MIKTPQYTMKPIAEFGRVQHNSRNIMSCSHHGEVIAVPEYCDNL